MAPKLELAPAGQGHMLHIHTHRSVGMRMAAPEPMGLPSSAIVGIVIAGSAVLMLLVGPVLIQVAKWQDRQRGSAAAACPVSGLEFSEYGQQQPLPLPSTGKLRKKGLVASHRTEDSSDEATTGRGRRGAGRLGVKRLSLPVLPPVFSRPGSFVFGNPFSGSESPRFDGRGGSRASFTRRGSMAGPRPDAYHPDERRNEMAEKRRGYLIHQNRRKSSWIDEDALHGPRVSPSKRSKRSMSWLGGNGLTRTLSRHLSLRRHSPSRRVLSPTLPSTVTGQGRAFVNGAPPGFVQSHSTGDIDTLRRLYRLPGDVEMGLRLTEQQQQGAQGTVSMDDLVVGRVRVVQTTPPRLPVSSSAPSDSRSRRNTALEAAHQLAGRARVPSMDGMANPQLLPRAQQIGRDAEMQAILRRKTERPMQHDRTRSARRQTLVMPPSAPSFRVPEQALGNGIRECRCCNGQTDMNPSPARSQRSAPAVMLYPEVEGNPSTDSQQQGIQQQAGAVQPEYRYTHSRQISHVSQMSQVSQVSMLSEPDSMVVTPSKRGSQPDVIHTALSSPSRATQTSPNRMQQVVPNPRSYSPSSDQSSALSTLYSEEECSSPPTSVSRFESGSKQSSEMERRDVIETANNEEANSPRSVHRRKGTLGQDLTNIIPDPGVWALQVHDSALQTGPRPLPMAPPTLKTPSAAVEDPFTAFFAPVRSMAQRLSQVFSPLPAELPGSDVRPLGRVAEVSPETPTPSPSHKRVVPPPQRLQPSRSSPTLGYYQDTQPEEPDSPSRVPSPVQSESGLSSVYDSYRYSRYSDSFEGSQMLSRLSTMSIFTAPNPEGSPAKHKSDEETIPAVVTDGRSGSRTRTINTGPSRARHLRQGFSGTGSVAYKFPPAHSPLPVMTKRPADMGPVVDDTVPRSKKRQRDSSLSSVDDLSAPSTYSQDDEEGDRLAPLVPAVLPGAHTTQVTNTVAELRRMNSQVSCVSGYSTATAGPGHEEIASPTLPALRGGGFSPGKKGAMGGSKNYLSLGSSPEAKGAPSRNRAEENGRTGQGIGKGGNDNHENKAAGLGIQEDRPVKMANGPVRGTNKGAALHGGAGRSRRNTVVDSFEQDLNRARRVLRDSRVLNLRGAPGASEKVVPLVS